MGAIILEGGAEFGGKMELPDRLALHLAGGMDSRVIIVPTAAAPDNNHRKAGENGRNWFKGLGAANTTMVPLIDDASAEDSVIIRQLRQARLIYLLGGFPGYLADTLAGSSSWRAILEASRSGAVVAGSSAGAMVLCEVFYDPRSGTARDGLGLVPHACVLPHHNRVGGRWARVIQDTRPETILLGIDEETGVLLGDRDEPARVLGRGRLTIYRPDGVVVLGPEEEFSASILRSQ
jgi:cyanophycinase